MKLNRELKRSRKKLKVEASRVIILGAGEVGRHIAQRLAGEGYSVILIDKSENKIRDARFLADIGTYVGNACNPDIYLDIALDEKDLFIAVTSSDEANLMSCHIAKALGCAIKIARVRNHFYKNFTNEALAPSFWRKLGVEILLNQDEITTAEILKLIENPGSVEAIDLGNQEMQLVAYRVREDSLLCGRRLIGLKDVPIFSNKLIVAAVRNHSHPKHHDAHISPVHIKAPTEKSFFAQNSRKSRKNGSFQEETLIPKGNFRIQEGDILYVSGLKKEFQNISGLFDTRSRQKLKHIFILGGSGLASLLSEELVERYPRNNIYLILKDKKEAYATRDQVDNKVHILLLDLHNVEDLVNEGLDEDCIFVGASDSEDNNILACLLVKEETGARTITIVQSSIYNHVMPYMDIDAVVIPKMLLVDDVLKALRKNVYDVLFSKGNDAEVLEFVISEKFPHTDSFLKDIPLPENSILAGVVKGEEMHIPQGSTPISVGDHAIVFCLKSAVEEVQEFFSE